MPDRNRTGGRPEFEVAYYTKELGKALQRQMLEQQLARLSDAAGRQKDAGEQPDASPVPSSDERKP